MDTPRLRTQTSINIAAIAADGALSAAAGGGPPSSGGSGGIARSQSSQITPRRVVPSPTIDIHTSPSGGHGHHRRTLLDDLDDDGRLKRTGTIWTASAHIITAVIGSGVLSLAWSMSKLGWIAGPLVLLAFALITYYTSLLLADCYRSTPTPINPEGKRNYTYMDAVRQNLGGMHTWLCAIMQYTTLVGTSIGYTITSSMSMVAIKRVSCLHGNGHDTPCITSNIPYMLMFGGIQIILSQISNFSELWWLSIVAAIMSFSYSFIGLGLVIGHTLGGSHSHETLKVTSNGESQFQMASSILQALGNIAFAYSYSNLLIEIQDTIKSSPPENKTMKKANLLGVSTTTMFYMLSGCIGYAAFGIDAPGNILTGFENFEPYFVIDLANLCVVVHLVGAFQVFCQPVFAAVENWASMKYAKNQFIHKEYEIQIPLLGEYSFNSFRLIWRTTFVVFTTLTSMMLPFFNDILGILGAVSFWPLTVYFPIQMYIVRSKTKKWCSKWLLLQLLSLGCLLISLAAFMGSIVGVVKDLDHYNPFKTHA